jgi:hypothetical protein
MPHPRSVSCSCRESLWVTLDGRTWANFGYRPSAKVLGAITLRNVSISSRDAAALPRVGWLCDNATRVAADGVVPAVCQSAAKFGCSET